MTLLPGYPEWRSALLVAVTSLVVLAAVLVTVRGLARHLGWSPARAGCLAWPWSLAVVAVVLTGLAAPWTSRPGYPEGWTVLLWGAPALVLLWAAVRTLVTVVSGRDGPVPALFTLPLRVALPALWLVSWPLQWSVLCFGLPDPLAGAGLAAWLVGQALVATGRTDVGDVVVWAGLALVAVGPWEGVLVLVSPLLLLLLALLVRRRRIS